MSKFKLKTNERGVDEATVELRSHKRKCFIYILDPFEKEACILINVSRGSRPKYKLLHLDLWRANCDFSDKGQRFFSTLGYRCGPRVLSVETKDDMIALALDKMLRDLALAPNYCFIDISL